tara:strand:- start:1125 stop:1760 length:636 start_codon:yes stop_codon:yes gene_type:complete
MMPPDVPSPIDLKDMNDAQEWERTAMLRPFREEFFQAFNAQLDLLEEPRLSVIELGAGPGFLAQYILLRRPDIDYTLLDFSPAMHTLAQRRLESIDSVAIQYIECDFKTAGWATSLGQYDAVLCNQAVHELRHKRYAPEFFERVRSLLKADGVLLFCDHYCGEGGLGNDQLYMSLEEQREVLRGAGFKASAVLVKGGRALYSAMLESKGSE